MYRYISINILKNPVNLWAEIPLTDIHQLTINSYKLTTTNYQHFINNCEHWSKNKNQRNNTKMRKLENFNFYEATNPVQYWVESHNYTEN